MVKLVSSLADVHLGVSGCYDIRPLNLLVSYLPAGHRPQIHLSVHVFQEMSSLQIYLRTNALRSNVPWANVLELFKHCTTRKVEQLPL